MLTRSDIDDILKLIDGSDFLELKLEMGDLKLELRRPGAAPAVVANAVAAAPPASPASRPAPVAVSAPVVASGGGAEVPAPLLGIFWHAPRPGADPFVKPGDRVTADTVIGIIEVMKLMNSVAAGVEGVVTEVCVENGQPVQYGDVLFRIRPA
jgi:acetyl-CoA carboxylase biotin carboxyl carrier protein